MVSGLPAKSEKGIRFSSPRRHGDKRSWLLAKARSGFSPCLRGELELQFLPYQLHDNRMRFAGRAARVHDMHASRLALRNGQVRVTDASKKGPAFLFKTVLVFVRTLFCPEAFVLSIATTRPLDAESQIIVQQDRKVGLQIAAENFVQLQHRFRSQLAASTLVRLGRIGETVAEHDASFGEHRQNDLVNVLGAGSEHERHFRERRKSRGGGMQQHIANLFARASSSWLTGNGDRKAVSTQRTRQLFSLGALAAAIETFEGNKSSTRGHVGMIAGGN